MTIATTLEGFRLNSFAMQAQNQVGLYAVHRQDGEDEYYTSHDEDLRLPIISTLVAETAPVTFRSAAGIDISTAEREIGLRSRTATVAGVIDGLDLEDIQQGRYLDAFVEQFHVDSRWPSIAPLMYDVFWIVNATYSTEIWRFDIEGQARRAHENIGGPFNRICRFSLGRDEFGNINAGCGEDRSAIGGIFLEISNFTYGTTSDPLEVIAVSSTAARHTFRVKRDSTSPTMPLGRPYRFGRVQWLTGNNVNRTYEIGAYDQTKAASSTDSGDITTATFMGGDVQVGDTCIIEEGCDRLFSTCRGTYGNRDNYGGYNQTPGTTRARQSPRFAWV